MKIFDTVVIGCDMSWGAFQGANAIRAALETLSLRAQVRELVQKWQVEDFFKHKVPASDHAVLVCHGAGKTAEDLKIMLELLDQKGGDYSNKEDWFRTTLDITPNTLGQYVENAHGTFICLACDAGREAWGKAFLDAGFDAYIASERASWNGAFFFVVGYFYHRMMGNSDGFNRQLSQEECVKAAAAADGLCWDGTGQFRLYKKGGQ